MKKFKFTISLVLVILLIDCQKDKLQESIQAELEYVKKDSSHLLVMTVENNSNKALYIPHFANFTSIKDNLKMIDSTGSSFRTEFITQESRFIELFYNPSTKKFPTDYCNDEPFFFDYDSLFVPPITRGQKLQKKITEKEYEKIINDLPFDPELLTKHDIHVIKSMIHSKYSNALFIKPNEVHSTCETINTLIKNQTKCKIYLKRTPHKFTDEIVEYSTDKGDHTVGVPNKPMIRKFKGYHLFNKTILSDTLKLPPDKTAF